MKKLLLFISVFTSISFTQNFDCTGGRYYTPVFSAIDSIKNVTYGNAATFSGPQSLECNIYMPSGDTETERPVIILAHGGSFISGDLNDPGTNTTCRWLARMGYVAISMEYRLVNLGEFATAGLSAEVFFMRHVYKSIHDQKAMIRFLRKSYAESSNPYKINPNVIIVGGFSAGAILAINNTYMDTPAKVPSTIILADDGGFEGASGNPGYSSIPQAVLNFCGALKDSVHLEAGDQPMMSIHGTADDIVPYGFGTAYAGPLAVTTVHGSASLHARALNVGVTNPFKTYVGAGHCAFWETPEQSDTTFQFVADFLQEQICVQNLFIENNDHGILYSVYPNPTSDELTIDIPGNEFDCSLEIINSIGQVVYTSTIPMHTNITNISLTNIEAGNYIVKLKSSNRTSTKKLVIVK